MPFSTPPRPFTATAAALAVTIASALVAGCAVSVPDPNPPPVHYSCEDGTRLRVRFDNTAQVAHVVLADGTTLHLPQQRAASGIWYATPQHELRGKGDDATWTVGRRVPVRCAVVR